jgi:DNA-binding NarL/FixJ family response regulator
MRGESVNVLLADDSELICKAIRSLLSEAPGIKFLGEARTFSQTVKMASSLRPNVVLLDLKMPERQGFTPLEVKSQLRESVDRIIAISMANDDDARMLADKYGAYVLLDKMNLGKELIPTLLGSQRTALGVHRSSAATAAT